MTEPLAPYYYLDNFRFLLNWVEEHHLDLLSEEELGFIRCFSQLDRDSQCLLVRMIGRKGIWFRASKLRYVEIEDHRRAAQQLIETQLICSDTPLSLTELASVLTKPELLLLFADHLHSGKNQRKEILIQRLNEQYSESKSWSEWTNKRLDDFYHLKVQPISDTLMLLFFGNAYQDLTEFVLQDLGLYRYEKYTIDKLHRIFKDREEITRYQQLLLLREQLSNATEQDALEQIVPHLPQKFESPAMERRRARLFNQLAYEFERYGQINLALQLYEQVNLPPARERRIRLLEKKQEFVQAWELLAELMADPASEHELQVAERMAPRLARKTGVHYAKKITLRTIEQKLVLEQIIDDTADPVTEPFLSGSGSSANRLNDNGLTDSSLTGKYLTGNFLKVEEIARRHFDSASEPCVYVENQLLNGLLGLWLWPEMFRSIDGAFSNPFQSAPLDLYQEDFEKNRPGIRALWRLLDDQTHTQHIREIWQQKMGIANHFVNWQFMNEEILNIALACIPANHLKLIFQRLLFDLKANRSGLPDLIQFFPQANNYRMIEVKGPGDRIQDNQQRWLNFFSEHDIPVEVCYVSWRQG